MDRRKKVITEEDVNATHAIRACVAIKDCPLLTDDIKVRAIKDIVYMVHKDSFLLDTDDSPLYFIVLFLWDQSKEGDVFWDKINKIIGKF